MLTAQTCAGTGPQTTLQGREISTQAKLTPTLGRSLGRSPRAIQFLERTQTGEGSCKQPGGGSAGEGRNPSNMRGEMGTGACRTTQHQCPLWFRDRTLSFPATHHRCPPGTPTEIRTHSLGGRDPQAVLLHVEPTGGPHLSDEIQVSSVLRLLTLPPAVPSNEVKEAAGKDKETAVVGRPSKHPQAQKAGLQQVKYTSRKPRGPRGPKPTNTCRSTRCSMKRSTAFPV